MSPEIIHLLLSTASKLNVGEFLLEKSLTDRGTPAVAGLCT
jgi:hypothetical protein